MLRNKAFWLVSGVAAGALLTRWQLARLFAEQLDYEVERRVGDIEIRRYPRCARAETVVHAESFEVALEEGFRRLAAYIFGANHARPALAAETSPLGPEVQRSSGLLASERHGPITAPVTARIEMTTPVQVRGEKPDPKAQEPHAQSTFIITFTMPKSRTPSSLPAPNDERIHLRSVPSRRVAVIRYRGRHTFSRVRDKSSELLEAVADAGLPTRGQPEFAGYDPPTTLPWLRRNEIWIELAGTKNQRRKPTLEDNTSSGEGP